MTSRMFLKIMVAVVAGIMLLVASRLDARPGGGERGWPDRFSLKLLRGTQITEPLPLAGARNEHLFLPVELESASPLITVEVQDLPPDLGITWRFYRVVAAPAQPSGDYAPDALLPLEETSPVTAPEPLLIWVALKIPPTCTPGLHPLTLIFSGQEASLRVPVNLRVYRFTLPDDLPIAIFGGFWHAGAGGGQPGWRRALQDLKVIKAYYQSLRAYKVNALGGSYPLPVERLRPGSRMEDFPAYHELVSYALDDLKFRAFQIPKLGGWQEAGRADSSFARRAREFYPLMTDYLRRHGWEGRALNYLVDEPRPDQHQEVLQAYALARSLAPGVRTLSAGWSPSPEFARVIDIWAWQAGRYHEGEAQAARQRGQEVWLYANRFQGSGQPLARPRLIGWLLHRYGFSGYLLWGVNYWPEDPWSTPPGPRNFYRKGTFYYPHPQTGLPVATTRLEALRRGFQDYQYLTLLAQAAGRGLVPRERYEAIQARVARLTDHLPRTPGPTSMADMEALRLEMGELLDRAESAGK